MALTQQNISSFTQTWVQETASIFLQPIKTIRGYQAADFRPDFIAAMTVAFVMLPQAIAYAMIAELPPQTGLFAAIVATIVGSLWGSSFHLHTGPTNTTSLLVLSTLLTVAVPGTPEYIAAAGLMAVMVGVIRLLMGVGRLGFLVNFMADSVIVGFTVGAGILIGANQLRHLFRLDLASSPSFYTTIVGIMSHITETHLLSLFIGLATVLLILVIKKIRPKWPNALLAMVATTAMVAIFGLDEQGVLVLGELPSTLPPFSVLPLTDTALIRDLFTGALAVSLIGLMESMSIARLIAGRSGQRVDNNQEFVGQGLANIAVGFFSGYTCSGSFTRSAVNYEAGAKTALAAPISGLIVLLAVLVFAPLAAYLPRAAVAGILLVTVTRMVKVDQIKEIWRTSAGDSMIMIVTMIATLLLPLEYAVFTGVMVSFIRYISITSTPNVSSMLPDENFDHFTHQPEQPKCPQLNALSIQGSLYFGATAHVEDLIRANLEENPKQLFLLLRMNRVNHCDVSGLHMLESVVRLYRQKGGDVFMMGVRANVWEKMELSGFNEYLGLDHFLSKDEAIAHIFYNILDPAICIYDCPVRAWQECQSLPKSARDVNLPRHATVPLDAIVPQLSPQQVWQKIESSVNGQQKPLLVDVRERPEFEGGHVPKVRLIEMPKLLDKQVTLPRDRQIILICRSGRRSTQVAYALQEDNYQHVFNLDGGMLAWKAAGLPVIIE